MRKENLIFLLIIIGAVFLRLVNLNQSFWLDEAAQVIESSRPLSQQLKISADFHPPLFHLLLHFWLFWGKGETSVRLLPVTFSIGSIVLLYYLSLVIGRKKEGLLACLFLALSPYHLWYSQETRPYILFLFLALLSTIMLVRKKWFWFTMATILCLYSSYFAPFLIASQIIYILFAERKSLPKLFLSFLSSFFSFIPWIPFFTRQLEVGMGGNFSGWSDVVSMTPIKASLLTFAKFIFGKRSLDNLVIESIILFPMMLLFGLSFWRMRAKKEEKAILIFFAFSFVFAFFTSFFIPILAPQRLIFLLPFFWLIIAIGISTFTRPFRQIIIITIVLLSFSGILDYYTNPYTKREQWKEAVSFVEKDNRGKSIVLFVFPNPFAPYLWYNKGRIEAVGIAPEFILQDKDLDNLLSIVSDRERVYLFQYLTGLTDPQEKTRSFLSNLGYRESIIKDFPGVGFVYVYGKR